MAYNNNFTDELRARLSIVDIVGRRVPLVKKGQKFWGCCPFHNEKTPSFTVDEERGRYHCFGCGEGGDIISFVMKTNNMDFKSAIAELAQMAGLKLPDYKPKSTAQIAAEESYFSISETAAKIYQEKLFEPAGAIALEYIKKRGFTADTIKKYRLGYAPRSNTIANKFANARQENLIATGLARRGDYGMYDFFRDKLMFPIMNPKGQVIAFSGRSLDGSEPKYINTSDTEMFHKRGTLFGLNFARDAIHRANRSIVVEGQIDAIQMQAHGFPETVAPLGTALTEEHVAILCKLNRNIIFCFDGDTAGQKAAARAASIALSFIRSDSDIRFAFMPRGADPDEVLKSSGGTDAMKKIIGGAQPLVDFFWDTANKTYLTSTPGGRNQAAEFIKKELEKIADIGLRAEFTKEYEGRKFNQWHKWKKPSADSRQPAAAVPETNALARRTLSHIAAAHPELIEKHSEFLISAGITFDDSQPLADDFQMTSDDAEKFIVSLKLKKYLERLNAEKKELTNQLLAGDESARTALSSIDSEITKSAERLDKISGI
jgi:DNA primase